ncbi:MAG: hydroxyacid dehydrogenase [Ruminococcaceae bacterium]|nr:hydroxyacid dehydrogenase [Oscillospiraceae bacterium]
MKITVLDALTLGDDLSLQPLQELGECTIYPSTAPDEVENRLADTEVAVLNKVKLHEANLKHAANLKLICVAATGYDNIDISYCRAHGIAVCNVEGYSSHSVAQLTVAAVLSLSTHLNEYRQFVTSGDYTKGGVANRLTPVYHELYGKTWGVVGFGGIGKEVGKIAEAFGCNLLVCKRTPVEGYRCVDIDTLCAQSDIITLHTPLNDSTRNLIDAWRLSLMKRDAILFNAARGAVTDEHAVSEAVQNGTIGGFGSDVYTVEPFDATHPFDAIKHLPNVLLTPHMAWGAYEARVRCLGEIVLNIKDFYAGGRKGRVD